MPPPEKTDVKTAKEVRARFINKSRPLYTEYLKSNQDWVRTKNLVLLSMLGNPRCQGDYLGAMIIQSLADHNFSTFLIADEIYWHNIKPAGDLSADQIAELRLQARVLGAHYFETQLEHFLKPFGITPEYFNREHGKKNTADRIAAVNRLAVKEKLNFEIVTWDKWVRKEPLEFASRASQLLVLYDSDARLRTSLHTQASAFAERHFRHAGNQDSLELLYARAKGYLAEESLHIMWLASREGYNFITYPGAMPAPFQATRDYFVGGPTSELAADDDFAIRVDMPECLVNWLDVSSTRAYALDFSLKCGTRHTFYKQAPTGKTEGSSTKGVKSAAEGVSTDDEFAQKVYTLKAVINSPDLSPAFKEKFLDSLLTQLAAQSPLMLPPTSSPLSMTSG